MGTRTFGIAVVMVASLQAVAHAEGEGILVVKSNAEGGTVLVDDEARGTIRRGKIRLELPEGRYRIAVEADGFARKELGILVNAGERTLQSISLAGGGPREPREAMNPWRPAFVVSAAATAGMVGAWFYSYRRTQSEADQIDGAALMRHQLTDEDCARPDVLLEDRGGHFARACTWHRRSGIAALAATGLSAVTLVTAYLAFIHPRSDSRRSLAVTPTVSPDGAGATVQLSW